MADRDYFQEVKQGKTVVGTVEKSKFSGNSFVPMAAPIFSKSGEFVGAVILGLKTDFLNDLIGSVKIGKTGYPFLADKRGLAIAYPKKEFILENNLAAEEDTKEIAAKMRAQQTGVETYAYRGVRKLAGYAPVGMAGWSVGMTQDMDEILAPVHSIRNFIFTIALIQR